MQFMLLLMFIKYQLKELNQKALCGGKKPGQRHIPVNNVLIAHASDGNFHTSICFDPAEEGQCKEAERLENFMVNAASAVEGTCTGEHRVRMAKLKFWDWTKHGPTRATKMTTQVDFLSEEFGSFLVSNPIESDV
ncbi:D-lactate dehydrogenase [Artemisia annua]|uniref:D-lactate dehydrogenase n=1 Tax=Artemisia annua TaxID=35608 RepID=A0A2U1MUU3_ARTAN|nr:D-lactate dehydrogenase [Artemisia annua]